MLRPDCLGDSDHFGPKWVLNLRWETLGRKVFEIILQSFVAWI